MIVKKIRRSALSVMSVQGHGEIKHSPTRVVDGSQGACAPSMTVQSGDVTCWHSSSPASDPLHL